MKQYSVNNLILEITRKCNMQCPHCLRGEPENCEISEETIRLTLQRFTSIQTIIFTGGEPSLNINAIRTTLAICKQLSLPVYGMFIATNGKENVPEFIKACDDWYEYTSKYAHNYNRDVAPYEIVKWLTDEEEELRFSVALSSDEYHENVPFKNLALLASRSYFSTSKMHDENEMSVIKMGRAKDIADAYEKPIPDHLYIEDDDIDEIYINVYGHIITHCDLSYEKQNEYMLGNIRNYQDFEDMSID